MKKLLLVVLLAPINLLFGQTVTADDLTPGAMATYTFTYTTANDLSGTTTSSDNLTIFALSTQSAFSAIETIDSSIDSIAAHMSVKINGVDEPVTTNNFSDWLSGISANGIQISLYGTGNSVQAGSEIEITFSGVFTNSATIASDIIEWSTAKGTGETVETFVNTATSSSASLNENNSNELNLDVYPNPAQNYLNISGFEGVQDYVIYNNSGAVLMTGETSENSSINIEQLTSGMYFFRMNDSDSIEFIKK